MSTSQVLLPYNEALAKRRDQDALTEQELENDRNIASAETTVSDVVHRACEAVDMARTRQNHIAFVDVKICFSACAQDIELLPPGSPEGAPSLRAKNLTQTILMCEVYNSLVSSFEADDFGIMLILMGYEGYRSMDSRHVQDSDDTMWLADTSPEQIPYVLWIRNEYTNDRLEYRLPIWGETPEAVVSYSFQSYSKYVKLLLQLEANAIRAHAELGNCYEALHVRSKLRWLLHRAKGELIRTLPLSVIAMKLIKNDEETVKEEFNLEIRRNWNQARKVLKHVSTGSMDDLPKRLEEIYGRRGEDTEQELLWQACTYRLFKVLVAKEVHIRHVNIYDRHELLTGQSEVDGAKEWLEEEDDVDRMLTDALGAESDEQLAPLPFEAPEPVIGEHYAVSMKNCTPIKRDYKRLKARTTWALPLAMEKECTVSEKRSKKRKTLVLVDSTKVVECEHHMLHRLKRAISRLQGVTVAGFGVQYQLSSLASICDTDVSNVVNRIVRGDLGYEAFLFMANLIFRGSLFVSKASTTASFVPRRNQKQEGVCITSFLSRSITSSATYGYIDEQLCWLPGEGLNPMIFSEDRKRRMTLLTEHDYDGDLR